MRRIPYKETPDAALWQLWKQTGDSQAGTVLCDRYFFPVLRFFGPKVRSDRDAEDLAQKTFLELVRSTAEPASISGYIFGIARFVLIRYIGGLARQPGPLDTETRSLAELDPGPGLTTLVAQDAERGRLVRALRQLPLDAQILLELHYWEELSGSELAEVLGVPEGTIRGRLAAAKRRLSGLLAADQPEADPDAVMTSLGTWVQAMRLQAPHRNH